VALPTFAAVGAASSTEAAGDQAVAGPGRGGGGRPVVNLDALANPGALEHFRGLRELES
jgi:hypothetical protein